MILLRSYQDNLSPPVPHYIATEGTGSKRAKVAMLCRGEGYLSIIARFANHGCDCDLMYLEEGR